MQLQLFFGPGLLMLLVQDEHSSAVAASLLQLSQQPLKLFVLCILVPRTVV